MDPNTRVEQGEHGLLIGAEGGNTEDGLPASFGLEAAYYRQRGELSIEFRKVGGGAGADLFLDCASPVEPAGQRPLDRSIHGEESVRDDFEAVEGCGSFGAGRDNPGGLHLRQSSDFAEATDHEYLHPLDARCEA